MTKRIYQAVCLVCYTCILETSTKKKDCERACVGHMNAYGHQTTVQVKQ